MSSSHDCSSGEDEERALRGRYRLLFSTRVGLARREAEQEGGGGDGGLGPFEMKQPGGPAGKRDDGREMARDGRRGRSEGGEGARGEDCTIAVVYMVSGSRYLSIGIMGGSSTMQWSHSHEYEPSDIIRVFTHPILVVYRCSPSRYVFMHLFTHQD